MWFSVEEVQSFLGARWSLPIRRVCLGLSAQMRQLVSANDTLKTPAWAKPAWLQLQIGEAIAARLAWQATQPGEVRYRFGRRSEPCWSQSTILPYERRALHRLEDEALLVLWGMDLERLYRIVQMHYSDVGETLWTLTLLGTCAHLAQVYTEFKRRCKARRARELAQWALRLFITWRADEAA